MQSLPANISHQLTNRTKQSHGEAFKYDGTYEAIGKLIKMFVAAAIPALEKFFQLVVFNYIFSNGDAHLKNFSLIRREESAEYQLTPAYDLMSTVIHTPQESDTALGLYEGDMNSAYYSAYGHYGRPDFIELAKRLGLAETRVTRTLNEFILKKSSVVSFVEESFLSDPIKELYIKNVNEKLLRIKA